MSNFPQKPVLKKNNLKKWIKTIFTLAIFILTFWLSFDINLISIVVITIVLFLHELAHLLAMKYYKYNDLSIFFIPFFGAATIGNKDEIKQDEKSMIILTGPLSGIIIGLILFGLNYFVKSELIHKLSTLFLVINALNLLPLSPLDGGRLVETLFIQLKSKVLLIFTIVSMIAIAFYAIYYESYNLMCIILILIIGLFGKKVDVKLKEKLRDEGYNLSKSYAQLTSEEYWKIRDYLLKHRLQEGFYSEPEKYIETEDEHLKVKQISNLLYKEPLQNIDFEGKVNIVLIWIFSLGISLIIAIYAR
jgi:stage IV sporulation protein FB